MAHKDHKLVSLIEDGGLEYYFYYFTLLELCGQYWSDSDRNFNPIKFEVPKAELKKLWRTNEKGLHNIVQTLTKHVCNIGETFTNVYTILIPNYAKYLGTYEMNSLQVKKSKVKKSKYNTYVSTDVDPHLNLNLSKSKNNPDKINHELIRIWNENCGDLPKVQSSNSKRDRLIGLRWKDNSDPNYWKSVVKKLSESGFCNGKNQNGWRASFDFLLQPNTHLKVMEGNYDNKDHSQSNWEKTKTQFLKMGEMNE